MRGSVGFLCFGRELLKHLDHSALLLSAEFREDRKAEHFRAEALGDGQRAGPVVQVGISRLAVDWNRVVDDRCDAGLLELLFQPVAAAGFREAEVGAVSGRGAA